MLFRSNGNVLTTTDPLGGVVANEYDALGRVVKVTDQAGGITSTIYDAGGNIIQTTDPEGNQTKYTYDALGRVATVTDPNGGITTTAYDANGNTASITNADGGIITYEYDKLDRLVKTTDAEGNTTTYTYDANSNQTSVTDGRGNTATSTYDALNRMVGQTDESGEIFKYVYDADGKIIKTINERGAETCYEYDKNGNIVKLVDAEGNSTDLTYDAMDRIATITNGRGAVTSYEYTPTGMIAKETDAGGNITTYTYDKLDRLIAEDASGLVTTYEYDALSNVVKTTSPEGASDTLTYDKNGNIVGATDANGNKTSYVLDGNGNIVQTIDALGNIAAFEYDAMNRLSKMTLHRVDTQDKVDEYQVTLYTYNKNGLVTKVINAAENAKLMVYDQNGNLIQQADEDGNVNTYTYSPTNLVTAINYADGKNVAYTYDEAGNLIEMNDWNGKTTYALDLLDRITSVNDHNGKTIRYAYDEVGNETKLTYPDGSTAVYTYDLLDRMTSVTDAEGKKTTYSYNAQDWKVDMTYPNGWIEEHSYDKDGRMVKTVDIDPKKKDLKSTKYTYTYDAVGNLLHEYKRGNGSGAVQEDVTYTYDALNRLIKAYELYGKHDRNYQYDSLGNLTYEQTGNNKSVDYKYNNLNQLTQKTVDGKDNYSYTYDKRGNQLSELAEKKNGNSGKGNGNNKTPTKWGETGTYVYNAANRMVEGTNTAGEKTVYNFNGLGMLVQNTWVVENNAYGYHDMNGKTDVKYSIKKPEIVVKDFVVDYNSPVQVPLTENEEGGLSYRYTYGLERVSVQIGGIETSAGNLVTPENTVKLYYHTDRLGSYRYLTDDVSGKITSWTDYDEWGNITHNAVLKMGKRQLDLVKNYTGHEYDNVIAKYYAKARMYDPQDKRFTQKDPAEDGLNWYTYCKDNPVVNWDFTGLFVMSYNHVLSSQALRSLQIWLQELGYMTPEVSSSTFGKNYGGHTKSAVQLFAMNYHLPIKDSIDDYLYLAIVNEYVAKKYPKNEEKQQESYDWAIRMLIRVDNYYKKYSCYRTFAFDMPQYRTPAQIIQNENPNATVCSYNGIWYLDYTDEMMRELKDNVKKFRDKAIGIMGWTQSEATTDKMIWFAKQVRQDGPWDLKLEDVWNKHFNVTYYSQQFRFFFNGKLRTAEDMGNIFYGYFGHAMNIGIGSLHIGSWATGIPSGQFIYSNGDRSTVTEGYNLYP